MKDLALRRQGLVPGVASDLLATSPALGGLPVIDISPERYEVVAAPIQVTTVGLHPHADGILRGPEALALAEHQLEDLWPSTRVTTQPPSWPPPRWWVNRRKSQVARAGR
ncbi:hypothetical protein [Salinispora arenicola]|uniref:hypothetical protein n=1 Tax=Salinispora arenicola TaxID=168697 RepID=UPI00207ABC41|nr:hypothetical protein [Salinispora arenicola]MCN0152531.1 hypothetical protein [Salinispora arenicola]